MAQEKIGDVQIAQGDLAGSLNSYRHTFAIRERLAQSDPGNASWQRDLSVAYGNLGRTLNNSGRTEEALDALQRGHAIMVRLAALSQDNAQWKKDLDWFAIGTSRHT